MDVHLGSEHLSLARRIVTDFDHEPADALFDRVLASTLFSFRTNRRIFRGIIRISDYERWQAIFDTVIDHSRWELDAGEADVYLRHSFQRVAEYLRKWDEAPVVRRDPTGDEALGEAKRVRRQVLRHEGWRAGLDLQETADRHFPPPEAPTPLWERRGRTPDAADGATRGLEASLPGPDAATSAG